ncbi:6-bladed beta-propeller [Gracilimonas halophila]|uniref:6-bladed beta-propeller n=1 Tax=Gracilimonas halophila TaxID=1834464 RepID=A0ABW5JG98_9BACT
MMNKLEFYFLPVLVLIAGCDSTSNSNQNLLEVKYSDGIYAHYIDPTLSIDITSEELENLKFVPLEATESSLVGNINKLEKDSTTGYWYILESNNPNKMFIFDKDGDFVDDIEHRGNGPGEYTSISDFYLSDGKWIEILDGKTHRLIRYDLKMDTLLLEKKLHFHAYKYSYLDDGSYVFYKNAQAKNFEDEKYHNTLLVIDSTMNVSLKALPLNLEKGINISISNPRGLFKTEAGVIFNNFNADTVYLVNSKTIRPLHTLDFGKYTVTEPKDIDFSSSQEYLNYYTKNKEKIAGAKRLVDSKNNFSFIFLYKDDLYYYFYEKDQDEAYIIDEIKFGSNEAFFPPPVEYIDSTFVSIYTAEMLREKITIENLKQGSDIYNAILEGKENQNPVLVSYQLNVQ